jgi:Domain of unknown function (DUF5615)
VPWKRVRRAEDWEMSLARRVQKAKLYADEDVEESVVSALRERGVNITSARELDGHRGKPDEWHAEHARKEGRFLLTKNSHDFVNDQKFPINKGYSIIVVQGDMSKQSDFARALSHVAYWIVPLGELHVGSKIVVGPDDVSWRFRSNDGSIVAERFRFVRGQIERWEDR